MLHIILMVNRGNETHRILQLQQLPLYKLVQIKVPMQIWEVLNRFDPNKRCNVNFAQLHCSDAMQKLQRNVTLDN